MTPANTNEKEPMPDQPASEQPSPDAEVDLALEASRTSAIGLLFRQTRWCPIFLLPFWLFSGFRRVTFSQVVLSWALAVLIGSCRYGIAKVYEYPDCLKGDRILSLAFGAAIGATFLGALVFGCVFMVSPYWLQGADNWIDLRSALFTLGASLVFMIAPLTLGLTIIGLRLGARF